MKHRWVPLDVTFDSGEHKHPSKSDFAMLIKVLIIAPSQDMLEALTNKLPDGYQVYAAVNLTELKYLLNNKSVHVIICMAGPSSNGGWDLCYRIKSNNTSAHIPLITITPRDTMQARVRSLEAGADIHIGGQVFREYLDLQIKNLIANRNKVRRHFYSGTAAGSRTTDVEKKQVLKKLYECQSEIIHHKNINVNELAKLMHMSRPTLYRKLKSVTDLTPHELINEARLKKAAELLVNGEFRASQVARMVGFTSQSSFGKSFLKQFKVTPATYQRMKKIMNAA